jgi:hypothetical protein
MPKMYFYKLTHDGGGAPCVEHGLLSLAICKPKIRVGAEPDDWIFGFTANSLDPRNRLIYIARVTAKARNGEYFKSKKYGGRSDSIYAMRGGLFAWKRGAQYHGPDDLTHDLGSPPDYPKAEVLLSNDFRYFGAIGTAEYKNHYPAIKKAFEGLGRGHRVHHDEPLRVELEELIDEAWRTTSRKVLGRPTTGHDKDACYRTASCGLVPSRDSNKC